MPALVLVAPHYWPETGAAANRCTALARELAALGWQVTVVTALPHHPMMIIPPEFDVPTPHTSYDGQVKVIRLRPHLVSRSNLVSRLYSEARFSISASKLAVSIPTDVIVASSPYFFLGPAVQKAAKRSRRPFVWDVRDLTWLYPRASGRKTFGTDLLFDLWMKLVAQRADGLITTSLAQMKHLNPKTPLSRVIPNGITQDQFLRYGDLGSQPAGHGKPRVTYVGLFGYMHGLATLVHTAALLPEVELHLYGDGPETSMIQELAHSKGLQNTFFHGHIGASEVEEAYRHASILVAPIRDREAFRMIQPAKIWEYLATGRPMIHAGNGESAQILEEHKLATVVAPEQPELLAQAIQDILAAPQEADNRALKARAWVAVNRNRDLLAVEWNDLLLEVVSHAKASAD